MVTRYGREEQGETMRRLIWVVVLLAGGSVAAGAQILSIYATSANTRISNSPTGTAGVTNSFWTSGIGGGVTVNMIPFGPVRVGLDMRGSTRPGTNGTDTAMGGLKLGFHPPLLRIKPYVQASGGYIATRTQAVAENHYAGWEILGGVDFPIAPFFDFRAIELGGGSARRVGSGSGQHDISLFTVNTGLVFHF